MFEPSWDLETIPDSLFANLPCSGAGAGLFAAGWGSISGLGMGLASGMWIERFARKRCASPPRPHLPIVKTPIPAQDHAAPHPSRRVALEIEKKMIWHARRLFSKGTSRGAEHQAVSGIVAVIAIMQKSGGGHGYRPGVLS